MFHSWVDAVIFGIITSFVTGIFVSIIVRGNVNKMNKPSI